MSSSGISWAICKSAPSSRQITTPAPHHAVLYRPDDFPAAQPTVLRTIHTSCQKNDSRREFGVFARSAVLDFCSQLLLGRIGQSRPHLRRSSSYIRIVRLVDIEGGVRNVSQSTFQSVASVARRLVTDTRATACVFASHDSRRPNQFARFRRVSPPLRQEQTCRLYVFIGVSSRCGLAKYGHIEKLGFPIIKKKSAKKTSVMHRDLPTRHLPVPETCTC